MKCEICESIIGGDYTPPSLNENRCADCEFIEMFIKNRCFICLKDIENTLQHYITYGNMCMGCNNIIIKELTKKDKVSRPKNILVRR